MKQSGCKLTDSEKRRTERFSDVTKVMRVVEGDVACDEVLR